MKGTGQCELAHAAPASLLMKIRIRLGYPALPDAAVVGSALVGGGSGGGGRGGRARAGLAAAGVCAEAAGGRASQVASAQLLRRQRLIAQRWTGNGILNGYQVDFDANNQWGGNIYEQGGGALSPLLATFFSPNPGSLLKITSTLADKSDSRSPGSHKDDYNHFMRGIAQGHTISDPYERSPDHDAGRQRSELLPRERQDRARSGIYR